MSTGYRYDSPVARFTADPLTRAWPEPSAVDALFRYCVQRFFAYCQANPRAWLTEQDLHTLLAEIMREELPRHGLPACAVHLGYTHQSSNNGQTKPARGARPIDLVLLIPDTIHWEADGTHGAVLALAASVLRGCEPLGSVREGLARLMGEDEPRGDILRYLVVMGYHDSAGAAAAAAQAAQAAGIPCLSANLTALGEPVSQDKLL